MRETQPVACREPEGSAKDDVALRERLLVVDARTVDLAAEAARHRHAPEQSLSARSANLLRPVARLAARLQRSAVKRMRRFTAESVTLGSDFGLDGAVWEAFVARQLRSAGPQPRDKRSFRLSEERLAERCLWIVFTAPPAIDFARDLVAASLAGARRLDACAPFGVACVACVAVGRTIAESRPHDRNERVDLAPDLAAALERPGGDDLVALLRPGDVLRPEFAVAAVVQGVFEYDIVLMDGAMRERPHGTDRVWPVLHPGLNYLHALNCDHFCSRAVVRCGAARAALARGARDVRGIVLDVMGRVHAGQAVEDTHRPARPAQGLHLDLPLLELTDSPERIAAERAEMVRAGTRPVFPNFRGADSPTGRVSVVICTKDRGFLLRQLADRLLGLPADRIAEVIVVQNGTTNPIALRSLEQIARDGRIIVLEHEGDFNFSAQCNRGAALATGDHVLLLNDDIVPLTPDWLDCLLAPFADPKVAIAGPLLLYPDERIQQAGMFLGHRGTGGHTLRFARIPEGDYMFMATAPRYVSAVTGAAMLVERGFWHAAQGLDISLSKTLQDVDFCIRAVAAGRRVVYAANAVLLHIESVSARATYGDPATAFARRRELELFGRRLAKFGSDPFHNAAFDTDDETLHRLVARRRADHSAHQATNGKSSMSGARDRTALPDRIR